MPAACTRSPSPAPTPRLVARTPGAMFLQDISRRGGVLLTHAHSAMRGHQPSRRRRGRARPLTGTTGRIYRAALWPDGRVLHCAQGEGGGPEPRGLPAACARRPARASRPKGHGTGDPRRTVGRRSPTSPARRRRSLLILPTGAGEARLPLPADQELRRYHWDLVVARTRRAILCSRERARPAGAEPALRHAEDVGTGVLRAWLPTGRDRLPPPPDLRDGAQVLALAPGLRRALRALARRGRRAFPGAGPPARTRPAALQWAPGGRTLLVRRAGPVLPRARVDRVDLRTGSQDGLARTPVRSIPRGWDTSATSSSRATASPTSTAASARSRALPGGRLALTPGFAARPSRMLRGAPPTKGKAAES